MPEIPPELLERKNYRAYNYAISYCKRFSPLLSPRQKKPAGRCCAKKQEKGWKSLDLEGKALTAQLLYRIGNQEVARRIVNSLVGYATVTDEGIWWQNIRSNRNAVGDIRLHTLLMNTVALVTPQNAQLTGMAAWLLQQKETRDWGSIPATLDAISALISHSTLTLDTNTEPIRITWGKDTIAPGSSDIDGYTQIIKEGTDITPDLGTVSITTENNGLKPWVGLYRQYFVDADKIESQGNGLSIKKHLYVVRGDSLLSLSETTPEIGDKIQTRLIISSDRDLDFVAIKDNRAACLEPAEQQSRMIYQEGLSYFQETRDAATRFYIEHLPKGLTSYVTKHLSTALDVIPTEAFPYNAFTLRKKPPTAEELFSTFLRSLQIFVLKTLYDTSLSYTSVPE